MWFAEFSAREFQQHVGMPIEGDGRDGVKPMSFHTFTAGATPKTCVFTPKDHAFDAIGYDDNGYFTFGLGIQLELGPRTTPRQNFVLGVRARPSSDGWECTTTFPNFATVMLKERIDRADLQSMADAIYRHLVLWLEKQAKIFDWSNIDPLVEKFRQYNRIARNHNFDSCKYTGNALVAIRRQSKIQPTQHAQLNRWQRAGAIHLYGNLEIFIGVGG